ncbi:hypothetical protein SNEBB_008032 [Seison nebaliae]|nr:hypothetical protein SNEBB_008032 [Seison nebaliae]
MIKLFSFIFLIYGINCEKCGTLSGNLKKRLTFGDDPRTIWPWTAFIAPSKCTGVLIRKNFILTLASCISKIDQTTFRVTVGVRNTKHTSKTYSVRNIIIHEKYVPQVSYLKTSEISDIALIEIDPVVNARPICLAKYEGSISDGVGAEVLVSGYGAPYLNAAFDGKLREINMQITYPEDCLLKDVNLFCANSLSVKKTVCTSDKGSPAMMQSIGQYYVYGLAINNSRRCVKEANFIEINPFISWIQSKLLPQKPSGRKTFSEKDSNECFLNCYKNRFNYSKCLNKCKN